LLHIHPGRSRIEEEYFLKTSTSIVIIIMIFGITLSACRNPSPAPTSIDWDSNRSVPTSLTNTPSPTHISKPANTFTPTASQTPTIPIILTPTYDLSKIRLSEATVINIDGFACAAAISVNILGPTTEEILCDDIGVYMRSSISEVTFPTISDFFIYNFGTYLNDNELPISVYLDTSLNYDGLQAIIQSGKLPIAVIRVNEFWHAIVIVGYDPSRGGYHYLDSLYATIDIYQSLLSFKPAC
jgi:hypothetical protein